MKYKTNERRQRIKEEIYNSSTPITATALAKQFNVSRQIVVGDVAILKAANEPIIATPRGYIYEKEEHQDVYMIACFHSSEDTQDELNIIVDCGGTVVDVIVNHPVYGELKGNLNISNRLDVEEFISKCKDTQAKNLSDISDGIHLHTIKVQSTNQYETIIKMLREKGYLYEKS